MQHVGKKKTKYIREEIFNYNEKKTDNDFINCNVGLGLRLWWLTCRKSLTNFITSCCIEYIGDHQG